MRSRTRTSKSPRSSRALFRLMLKVSTPKLTAWATGGGMRAGACLLAVLLLSGCGLVGAQMAKQAVSEAEACVQEIKSSPDGKIVYARVWAFDDTDTPAKLSDSKPLTQDERAALLRAYKKLGSCRQIIIAHDNQYAAWETPYWQEAFQRSDAIFTKLVSGEMAVGVANQLAIESMGKFQVDVSKGHADAVRIDEIQRQQAAQAMAQASKQLLASQQVTTTNCSWFGNTLNCTSMQH